VTTEQDQSDAVQPGFLPSSPARREAESVFVRVIATAGIAGIGTLLGAVLTANDVAGWIVGLAVALVSVILAAVLWRSRTL
jgi:protein-S-isoprenylcysteine O-methyltransferase Ste14